MVDSSEFSQIELEENNNLPFKLKECVVYVE